MRASHDKERAARHAGKQAEDDNANPADDKPAEGEPAAVAEDAKPAEEGEDAKPAEAEPAEEPAAEADAKPAEEAEDDQPGDDKPADDFETLHGLRMRLVRAGGPDLGRVRGGRKDPALQAQGQDLRRVQDEAGGQGVDLRALRGQMGHRQALAAQGSALRASGRGQGESALECL